MLLILNEVVSSLGTLLEFINAAVLVSDILVLFVSSSVILFFRYSVFLPTLLAACALLHLGIHVGMIHFLGHFCCSGSLYDPTRLPLAGWNLMLSTPLPFFFLMSVLFHDTASC